MKPLTHDWGDIRSALHEPGLEVMERAQRLERALPDGDSEALRCYILAHLPNWEPTSSNLPYELVCAWMRGELMDLLGVLCRDGALVDELRKSTSTWYEVGSSWSKGCLERHRSAQWSYHIVNPSIGRVMYEQMCSMCALPPSFERADEDSTYALSLEAGKELLEGIFAKVFPPHFGYCAVSFQGVVDVLENGCGLENVEIVLGRYNLVSIGFCMSPVKALELIAIFRFFASLGAGVTLGSFGFEFVHLRSSEEEMRESRNVKDLWDAYRRLCWPQSKYLPMEEAQDLFEEMP